MLYVVLSRGGEGGDLSLAILNFSPWRFVAVNLHNFAFYFRYGAPWARLCGQIRIQTTTRTHEDIRRAGNGYLI